MPRQVPAPSSAPRATGRAWLRRMPVLMLLVHLACALVTQGVWVEATSRGLAGTLTTSEATGARAAAAALATALVGAAAAFACIVSQRVLAIVSAVVAALAALGFVAASLLVASDPAAAVSNAILKDTGVLGMDVQAQVQGLVWVAIAAGVAAFVASLASIAASRSKRGAGTSRYARDASQGASADARPRSTALDPRVDSAATWDALSRGDDPTQPNG